MISNPLIPSEPAKCSSYHPKISPPHYLLWVRALSRSQEDGLGFFVTIILLDFQERKCASSILIFYYVLTFFCHIVVILILWIKCFPLPSTVVVPIKIIFICKPPAYFVFSAYYPDLSAVLCHAIIFQEKQFKRNRMKATESTEFMRLSFNA